MQIEPAINGFLAACDTLLHTATKGRERQVFSLPRGYRHRLGGKGFQPQRAAYSFSVIAICFVSAEWHD